jgi:hypothetical protein
MHECLPLRNDVKGVKAPTLQEANRISLCFKILKISIWIYALTAKAIPLATLLEGQLFLKPCEMP